MTLEELMEGEVLLIDKPIDWTSFDAVNKIKWKIRKKYNLKKFKVGHAGTLDPKATGLLIICVGKATKKIEEIQNASKVYTGIIKLGVETLSFDTETEEINPKPFSHITEEQIKEAFQKLTGEEILQKPPIFSALKKDGKRLYELARKGIEVEIPARKISIYEFEITKLELPNVYFKVHCGKGTYIRSLANDVGSMLGCGGYLTALRREKIGNFSVENVIIDLDNLDKVFS